MMGLSEAIRRNEYMCRLTCNSIYLLMMDSGKAPLAVNAISKCIETLWLLH